jgi:hypothetical protein
VEITPLGRRITFGAIVFVLVGLGAYLIGPAAHGSGAPGSPSAGSPSAEPHLTPAASSVPASPSPAPGPTPSATTGTPDIYQWLPFTPSELGAAASAVRQFGDAYGTFSYTETPAAYIAPIARLASSELAAQIKEAYALPGVAAARTSARQVSTGTADIQSLRAFGPTSLTFVVQITENLVTATGHSKQATSYAITLTGTAATWQVSDIELQSAGNS